MDENEVLAVHAALHDLTKTHVPIRGIVWPIVLSKTGIRQSTVLGHRFMVQNSSKKSKYADMAKNGQKLTWCLTDRPWGLIVDGKIVKYCTAFLTKEQASALVKQQSNDSDAAAAGGSEHLQQQQLQQQDEYKRGPTRKKARVARVEITPKESSSAAAAATVVDSSGALSTDPFDSADFLSESTAAEPPSAVSARSTELLLNSSGTRTISAADVKLGRVLGRGAFGTVRMGMLHGTPVAVKKLHVGSQSAVSAFEREAALLMQLRHPNVVSTLGIIRGAPKGSAEGEVGSVSLVLELLEGGDLKEWIHQNGGLKSAATFTQDGSNPMESVRQKLVVMIQIILGICRGLNYLHHCNPVVIHRDLKPANVLLSAGNLPAPKITDFGVSREKTEGTAAMTRIGTPSFMAPEILHGKAYSEKADIYSLGMLLWTLLTAEVPFSHKLGAAEADNNAMAVMMLVAVQQERPPVPELADFLTLETTGIEFEQEYRQLESVLASVGSVVRRCWAQDPHMRPSCDEILETLASVLQTLTDPAEDDQLDPERVDAPAFATEASCATEATVPYDAAVDSSHVGLTDALGILGRSTRDD